MRFLLQNDCYLYEQGVMNLFVKIYLINQGLNTNEDTRRIFACQLTDLDDF